ncbi:MAG: alanine racemase [Psychromonas sp.]
MLTAEAVIDIAALRHNYQFIQGKCPTAKIAAVLKANAYGHGAVRFAKALPQADAFAVSRLQEAVELREAGIEQPILLLEGCFCPDELHCASALNIHTMIHNQRQLQELEQADLSKPVQVWLKIDTGMHRLGVLPEQVDDYYRRIKASANAKNEIRFASHFNCADELESSATSEQIACFEKATQAYCGGKSLSNSAAILHWPDAYYDWLRPGIALYGIAPRVDSCGRDEGLRAVMTLKSKLISVREHKQGDALGYGKSWVAPRDTRIGVVAMGYGDGYPRTAPSGTPVLVNGRRASIVGTVSMDMITVDLGPDSKDQVGDEVIFWGDALPVEEIARHIGTIAYELIIKLTARVKKSYIGV